MFNLLILHTDVNSVKNICNNFVCELSEIHLCGITTSIEEFDIFFEKNKPDIILMDYQSYIKSKYTNYTETKLLKILFCSNEKICKCTATKLIVPENINLTTLLKSVKIFISKQSTELLRKKVIKLLQSFCFDFKLIGTTYLLESILYCYEHKTDYVFENLEKKVYPFVATLCNVNVCVVKHAIIRSINIMHCNLSTSAKKQLAENFKVDIFEKTTAKQFISMVVTKL